jgi:hypothetical protein
MKAKGGASGGRPSVAGKVESNTPVNTLTYDANRPTNDLTADEPNKSSAPPSTNVDSSGGGLSTGQMIGLGLPLAVGGGLWGLSKFAGGGASGAPPTAPIVDPARLLGGPQLVDGGVPNPGLSTMGAPAEGWPPGTQSWTAEATQKAIAGPEPALPGVQPYQPTAPGVQPVPPATVSNMPVGPSTADPAVLNEANIAGGNKPAPNVPFTPRAGGVPRMAPSSSAYMDFVNGLRRLRVP